MTLTWMYEGEQVAEEQKHHWEHEEGSVAGYFGGFVAYSVEDAAQEQTYDHVRDQPKLGQVLQQIKSKMVCVALTELIHSSISSSTASSWALDSFFSDL